MHFLLKLFLKAQKALLLSQVIHYNLVLTQIFWVLGNNKLHSTVSSQQKGFLAWQRARTINTGPKKSSDLGEFLWSNSSRDSSSVSGTQTSSPDTGAQLSGAEWRNLCQMNSTTAINLLPQTHKYTQPSTRKFGF